MRRATLDQRNPVISLREKHGLARKELLLLSGCTYTQLWTAERGIIPAIPRKLMDAFGKIGVDTNTLARAYQEYRETLGAEIVNRITEQATA